MRYRVHVVPPLRRVGGRLLLADWLAITVGRDIVAWRDLTPEELAHEVEHVRQWNAHGIRYVARYLRASWHAWRGGGRWYWDNPFEAAARDASVRHAVGVAAADAVGVAAGDPAQQPGAAVPRRVSRRVARPVDSPASGPAP